MSYETHPGSGLYDKGSDDAYFVFFWVLAFTFLRASVMKYVFTPFARAYGADTPSKQERFAEQGWSFTYYSIFWSLGMVRYKKRGPPGVIQDLSNHVSPFLVL
jgi:acyl-CoA-dependent ceramide synthase